MGRAQRLSIAVDGELRDRIGLFVLYNTFDEPWYQGSCSVLDRSLQFSSRTGRGLFKKVRALSIATAFIVLVVPHISNFVSCYRTLFRTTDASWNSQPLPFSVLPSPFPSRHPVVACKAQFQGSVSTVLVS